MSDKKIVDTMISFVEDKEHQLQVNKLLANSQAKNDTVKAILDKLEAELNENKNNCCVCDYSCCSTTALFWWKFVTSAIGSC